MLGYVLSDTLVYLGLPLSLWISFRICRYPDLALEQVFGLGAAIFAVFAKKQAAVWPVLVILPVLAICLGFASCYLRNRCQLHPILISLAAAYMYYSASLIVLGTPNLFFGDSLEVPKQFAFVAVAASVFACASLAIWALFRAKPGLSIVAAGCNWRLAKVYKLKPMMWQGVGMSIAVCLAMMSGALFAWRSGFADVNSGSGLLLVSIFAVFLTAMMQKRIHFLKNVLVLGASLAVFLFVLQLALNLGLEPQWLRGLTGAALLALLLIAPRGVGARLSM